MQKRCCLFTLFLLLSLTSLYLNAATTGKIAGRVIDAKSGEPLPGANVMIKGTNLGAATDIDGRYFILNVPPGTFTLQATMMGYTKVLVQKVIVNIDRTTQIDFKMQEQILAGEEVTVVAEREIVRKDLTIMRTFLRPGS